jgi:hypothetical protein
VAYLVELLYMILNVVDPVTFTLPASPDPPFHESSGELWDYKNSPQFNTTQSACITSPLFPRVRDAFPEISLIAVTSSG